MRKVLLSASLFLGGLMLAGTLARIQAIPTAPQSRQQSPQATKSVAGTIVSIGDSGRSFVLEVKGSDKQTLQFVLDTEAHVEGQVRVGTPVTVEYIAMADQNVAKTIVAQG